MPADMGAKLLCLCLASALAAYYLYTPLPGDIEEPWKVMLIMGTLRATMHLVSLVLGSVWGWPGGERAAGQRLFLVPLRPTEMGQCMCHRYKCNG